MLLYLKQTWETRLAAGQAPVSVIVAGLLPILWSHGAGSELMQRIAAPMVGGMITAPLLSLFLIPVLIDYWDSGKCARNCRRATYMFLAFKTNPSFR
jgi:Cu/Ag efflux pump CusA